MRLLKQRKRKSVPTQLGTWVGRERSRLQDSGVDSRLKIFGAKPRGNFLMQKFFFIFRFHSGNYHQDTDHSSMSRGQKRSSREAFGSGGDVKDVKTTAGGNVVLAAHRGSKKNVGSKSITLKDQIDAQDVDNLRRSQPNRLTQQNGTSQSQHQKQPDLKSTAASHLLTRQQLPIWTHQSAIRSAVRDNDVLLLVGETGSGKSTQVPQFLLDEEFSRRRKVLLPPRQNSNDAGKGESAAFPKAASTNTDESPPKQTKTEIGGRIAITEPRRVAATSLARRVAAEMGTPLGGKSGKVGYTVRFDTQTGPNTRIKYVTEGSLLQELLRDPGLREYSVVIVDEVHERGVDVDLVLGFLRGLCDANSEVVKRHRGDVPLKVVVMSATAEMDLLEKFFAGETNQNGEGKKVRIATLNIPGKLFPVAIHYAPEPVFDIVTAILERVVQLHKHKPLPGDILVFLPGQESIENLLGLLRSYAANLNGGTNRDAAARGSSTQQPSAKNTKHQERIPDLLPLPLYASLPAHHQTLAFAPAPNNFTRKVIIATNIAETSLTIPGIQYVVDSGRCKQRLYRPSLGMESLLVEPISKSSAQQRAGRAGRERKGGEVYRLWTEKDHRELLVESTIAEILRADLRGVMLVLKGRGVDWVGEGDGEMEKETSAASDENTDSEAEQWKWPTPPKPRAWRAATLALKAIGALHSQTGALTPVGRELSLLPLPAPLGRCLLRAMELGVVPQVVDIVSALSVEGVFLNINQYSQQGTQGQLRGGIGVGTNNKPNENEEEEEDPTDPRIQLRSQLYRREGDHLTLLATVQAYVAENSDRKRWCVERGVSHRAMLGCMDVRKQLTRIMGQKMQERKGKNGTAAAAATAAEMTTEPKSEAETTKSILLALLSGLHTNVAVSNSLSDIPSSSNTTSGKSSKTKPKTKTNGAGGPQAEFHPLSGSAKQAIYIHPSSVLYGKKVAVIMSSEVVFTKKCYARCVSAVELGWVLETARGGVVGL